MPPTGGKKPPFGSFAVFNRTLLLVSVSVPPALLMPPTAMLKAAVPPGALAVFPLTVLFVSVAIAPGEELRMPPNASLGVPLAVFSLTLLLISVIVLEAT